MSNIEADIISCKKNNSRFMAYMQERRYSLIFNRDMSAYGVIIFVDVAECTRRREDEAGKVRWLVGIGSFPDFEADFYRKTRK